MLLCGTGPCFGVLLHRHAPLQSSTCAPSIAPRLTPLRQKVLCASSTGWKPLKRVFQKPTGVSHTPAGEDKQDKPGIGNAPGGEVAEHGPSNNDSAKSTSRQETSESDQWNSISRAIVDQFGNTWASDEDYRLSSDGVWIPSSNGSPSDPSTSWALGSSKDNPADFESQWKACSAADENSGEDWTLGGGEASPPLGSDVGWTPGKANQGWTPGSLSSKASRKDFNATSGRTSNGTARQTVPSQHTPSGQVTERRFSKDDSDTFGSRRKPNSGDCEAIPGGNKAPSTEGSPRGAVVGWTPSNKANQGWMPSSLNSRAGQKESLATFRSTPTGAAHQAVPSQRSPTSQGTERGSSTNGSPSDSRDNPDISGSQWKPSSGKGDHNPGDRRNPSGQPSPSSPGIGWTPTSKATKEPSDGQRAPSRPTSKDSQNHPSANSRWAPSGTAHQTAPSQWTPDSQGTARNPNGGWPPSGEPATQHGPVAGWIPGRKVNADSPALSRSGWHRGHDADNQSRLEESINQLRAHVEVSAADWADWDDTPKVSTVIAEAASTDAAEEATEEVGNGKRGKKSFASRVSVKGRLKLCKDLRRWFSVIQDPRHEADGSWNDASNVSRALKRLASICQASKGPAARDEKLGRLKTSTAFGQLLWHAEPASEGWTAEECADLAEQLVAFIAMGLGDEVSPLLIHLDEVQKKKKTGEEGTEKAPRPVIGTEPLIRVPGIESKTQTAGLQSKTGAAQLESTPQHPHLHEEFWTGLTEVEC